MHYTLRVQINGEEIEVVEDFVYLGSLITAGNDTNRVIG